MTTHSHVVFGRLTLTLRPRKKLTESERKKLEQHFTDVDLWAFEKGVVLDHLLSTQHLAFKTIDGISIGIYNSGRVDIEAENVGVLGAPRIEKVAFRVLESVRRVARLKTGYVPSLFLHTNVKKRKLLRFMHTCSVSAMNPYLKRKLGEGVAVQGLLVGLGKGFSVGMILPDDLDFMGTYRLAERHKGLLRRVMDQAGSRAVEWGG